MSLSNDPYSLYFPVRVGLTDARVYIDENIYAEGVDCRSVPHSHHFYELKLIATGRCELYVGEESFSLSEDELVLIRPGESHHQTPVDVNDVSIYSIRFSVDQPKGTSAAESRAYEKVIELLSTVRTAKAPRGDTLNFCFRQTRREIASKRASYTYVLRELVTMILTELIRTSDTDVDAVFPPEDIRYRGVSITRLERFFSENMSIDVHIDDLATAINVSPRHAARIMRRFYSKSFSEKLTDTRLCHAAYLLCRSDESVGKIIAECGFRSSGRFYVEFKKRFGISPCEYRKIHTAENK